MNNPRDGRTMEWKTTAKSNSSNACTRMSRASSDIGRIETNPYKQMIELSNQKIGPWNGRNPSSETETPRKTIQCGETYELKGKQFSEESNAESCGIRKKSKINP